jgi:hypothetical protein
MQRRRPRGIGFEIPCAVSDANVLFRHCHKTQSDPRIGSQNSGNLYVVIVLAGHLRQSQYSTKKSRVILGYVGKRWEQNILAALDSALNKWMDTVPEHCAFPSPLGDTE